MENRKNKQRSSAFFAYGGRAEVLTHLTKIVDSTDYVAVLVGASGSGKTALCHALAQKVAVNHDVLYLAYPPQSFDDFIALLADKFKCKIENSDGEQNGEKRRLCCIEKIALSPKKILLICDNAQGIYLATLERIIKFISECRNGEADVHLILVGDPLVADACQSLSITEFTGSDVSVFTLKALDKTESGLFYQGLLGRGAEPGDSTELSAEVLESLYSKTDGNMKKINLIADRAAETDESDASFFSLLNDIEGEERGINKRLKRQVANKKKQHEKKRARTILLLGLLVVVLGVGVKVFFWGQPDEMATVTQPDRPQILQNTPADTKKEKGKVQTVASVAREDVVSVVMRESGLTSVVKESVYVSSAPATVVKETNAVAVKTSQLVVDKQPDPVPSPVFSKEPVQLPVLKTTVVPPAPNDLPVEGETVVVQENKKAASPEISQEKISPLIKSQQKIVVTATEQSTATTGDPLTSKQLYDKTIVAAQEWQKYGKESWYTMQLMALASESAEAHLQDYLGKDSYRAVVDSLRVIRGEGKGSPTLFVFYGEYSSVGKAKEARKQLPPFLLEHQPYVIPIAVAIKKSDS